MIALPLALVYVNSPESRQLGRNAAERRLDVDSESLANGVAVNTVFSGILGLGVRRAPALLVRTGFNWARIVITIFAVFLFFGLIGLFSTGTLSGIVTLLATLATIAAVVLLWMKPFGEYFTERRPTVRPRKFGN